MPTNPTGGELDARVAGQGAEALGPDATEATLPDPAAPRSAEEDLRNSEERYRRLVEDMPALICRFLPDGTLTFVNSAYCRYFGRTAEDLAGRSFFALIPEPDREDVRRHFLSLGHERPAVTYQHRVIGPDGTTRWQEWTDRVLFDEDGRVVEYQSLGRDITGEKQAEEERRRLEGQILHAQKLESLELLAGGIAHDFNNLLMVIEGNAELALVKMTPGSPGRAHLLKIEAAARRAAELTDQMLAYSGNGRFVIEPIDLNRLVGEMSHPLQAAIARKVSLRLQLAPDLPAVGADRTQLRQVVMNLISNASEAIADEAGTIVVRTGVVDVDRAYLAGSYFDDQLSEGRYVFLEVSDTGRGMDDDTLHRIFDPFFSTKFAGRGLGLAALLGIVRGHRGTIRVASQPGHGSTFTVLLPASPVAATAAPPVTEPAERARSTVTVLVVDDDEGVRDVVRMILEEAGFRVLQAADGRDGLDVFERHRDDIAVVILDMTMPRMSGEETFREIRRVRPDARVILSSGYDEQEAGSRLAGAELAGFIQKPYRATALLEKIQRLLDVRPTPGDDSAPDARSPRLPA